MGLQSCPKESAMSLCDKRDTMWLLSQHKDDKASLLLMTRQGIGNWLTAIRKGSWWAVPGQWNLQLETKNKELALAKSQVFGSTSASFPWETGARFWARSKFLMNLTQGRILCFWVPRWRVRSSQDQGWLVGEGWYDEAATPSKSWIPSLLWPCASSTQSHWRRKD